jgi:hypothetical protein
MKQLKMITAYSTQLAAEACTNTWVDVSTEAGSRGSVVVKALSYKPEGRGFDNR